MVGVSHLQFLPSGDSERAAVAGVDCGKHSIELSVLVGLDVDEHCSCLGFGGMDFNSFNPAVACRMSSGTPRSATCMLCGLLVSPFFPLVTM